MEGILSSAILGSTELEDNAFNEFLFSENPFADAIATMKATSKAFETAEAFAEELSELSGENVELVGTNGIYAAVFDNFHNATDFLDFVNSTPLPEYGKELSGFLQNLSNDYDKNVLEQLSTFFNAEVKRSFNELSAKYLKQFEKIDDSLKNFYNRLTSLHAMNWNDELAKALLEKSHAIEQVCNEMREEFLNMPLPMQYFTNLFETDLNELKFEDIIRGVEETNSEPLEMQVNWRENVENQEIADILAMLGAQFREHPFYPLFAVSAKRKKTKRPKRKRKIQSDLPEIPANDELFEAVNARRKVGGDEPQTYVSEADKVETQRAAINMKFAQNFFGEMQKAADYIVALVKNSDPKLIEFFSDNLAKDFYEALYEIRIPSLGYVPILSGYFRTAEAQERRRRYIETLKSSAARLSELAKTLPDSGKNVVNQLAETLHRMVNVIEKAVEETNAAFSKLVNDEISRIVRGDSALSKGVGLDKAQPSSKEAGAYTGHAHVNYMNAVSRIKSRMTRALAQHAVLMGIDKLKEYRSFGRAKMEEAVKKRLDELRKEYDSRIFGYAEGEGRASKETIRSFIHEKLESIQNLYEVMIDADELLSKIHSEAMITSDIKENLYDAIAKTEFAVSRKGMIETKLKEAIGHLQKLLLPAGKRLEIKTNADFAAHPPQWFIDLVQNERQNAPHPNLSDTVWVTPKVISKPELEEFKKHILNFFNFAPTLKFFIKIANILEASKENQFDMNKIYSAVVKYIIYSAIDFCNAKDTVSSPMILYYHRDNNDGRVIKSEINRGLRTFNSLYVRYGNGKTTAEDELFVMFLQAIVARLLYQLDQHRADFPSERNQIPGVERLLVGGAIGDPLGYTGSTEVIPEAVPLYIGLPMACEVYRTYKDEDGKLHGFQWRKDEGKEPQLVVSLPRGSRFRELLTAVFEASGLSGGKYSEAFIRKLVQIVNRLWESYSSISDARKRANQIYDAFFDEINNAVTLMTAAEHARLEAQREDEKASEYTPAGVSSSIGEEIKLGTEESKKKVEDLRVGMYEVLKEIAMSIFRIVESTTVSENQMINDYQSLIERSARRIAETPAPQRFQELVDIIRKSDNVAGDVVTLFTAFNEFVVTPFILAGHLFENVTYRMANAYVVIIRFVLDIIFINVNDNPISLYWNYIIEHDTSFKDRIVRILRDLGNLAKAEIDNKLRDRPNHGAYNYNSTPTQDDSELSNLGGLLQFDNKYKLPMHQPIYKAIQMLLLPCSELIALQKNGNDISIDASNLMAYFEDIKKQLVEAIKAFTRIGNVETIETYMTKFTDWDPAEILKWTEEKVNLALGIVAPNFYALRQYLPMNVDSNLEYGYMESWFGIRITEFLLGEQINGDFLNMILPEGDISPYQSYSGIFAPSALKGGQTIRLTGKFPWRDIKSVFGEGRVVAGGSTMSIAGIPLNNPGLYFDDSDNSMVHDLDQNDMLSVLCGAKGDPRQPRVKGSWSGPIWSLLFNKIPTESKTEIFNRLIANMVHTLTISGEEPVLLYEFANEITGHSALSELFQTEDSTIVLLNDQGNETGKTITYARLVNALPTIKTGPEFGKTGNPLEPTYILNETMPRPLENLVFRDAIQLIYDVCLYPFINSVRTKTKKRVDDIPKTDIIKYIASIPQYITALRYLLQLIELDEQLGLTENSINFTGVPYIGYQRDDRVQIDAAANDHPKKLKKYIIGFIEALYRTYAQVREKYGQPLHLEPVKGDHDSFKTAGGSFNPTKLCLPVSVLQGVAQVNEKGPVLLYDYSARDRDLANSLAWLPPAFDKRLTGSTNIPLEAIPWTVELAKQANRLTGADIEGGLQTWINFVARLTMQINNANLASIGCHNGFASPQVMGPIYHPHLLEANLAALENSFDSMYGLWNSEGTMWYSVIRFAYAPPRNIQARNPIQNKIPSGQDMNVPQGIATHNPSHLLFYRNVTNSENAHYRFLYPPLPLSAGYIHKDWAQNENRNAIANYIYMTVSPYEIASIEHEVKEIEGRGADMGGIDLARGDLNDRAEFEKWPRNGNRATNVSELLSACLKIAHDSNRQPEVAKLFKEHKLFEPMPSMGKMVGIDGARGATDERSHRSDSDTTPKEVTHRDLLQDLSYGVIADTKTDLQKCRKNIIGYGINSSQGQIELARLIPMEFSEEGDEEKRRKRIIAGLFLYLKRNPISLTTTLTLVPFPNIYNFSQIFESYYRFMRYKKKKKLGSAYARTHLPVLLLHPQKLDGYVQTTEISDYSKFDDKQFKDFTINGETHYFEDVYYPGPKHTFIKDFYDTFNIGYGTEIGFVNPSEKGQANQARFAEDNRNLQLCFPLFAMWIRFIDQLGFQAKEEYKARLQEIVTKRPDSTVDYKPAGVNIFE